METISNVTKNSAMNDDARVGAQAIEFWTCLADEELRRIEKNGHLCNYIMQYKQFLLDLVLKGIQKTDCQDDDDDLEGALGVDFSSGCCLMKISLILKNDVI